MSTPAFVALGIVLAIFGAGVFAYGLALTAGDGGEARRAIGLLVAIVSAAWVAFITSAVVHAWRLERAWRAWRRELLPVACDGWHEGLPCADAQCWRR